jgi:hypothetical protein
LNVACFKKATEYQRICADENCTIYSLSTAKVLDVKGQSTRVDSEYFNMFECQDFGPLWPNDRPRVV